MFLTRIQHTSRPMDPIVITPLKNPGDDIHNRRPDVSEECRVFMKQTNECLEFFGKQCGNISLKMGTLGITCFLFHKFTICVEVPRRDSILKIYTLLHRTQPTDSTEMRMTLLQKSLELNYLQLETFGATLSLDPCPAQDDVLEITLSYHYNLIGLKDKEFSRIMVNFLQTTRDLYATLMTSVNLPVHLNHSTRQASHKEQQAKRKVYVAYPKNHARDVKILDNVDMNDDVLTSRKTEKTRPRQRVALKVLQDGNTTNK